jgi:hypothetical protein
LTIQESHGIKKKKWLLIKNSDTKPIERVIQHAEGKIDPVPPAKANASKKGEWCVSEG